MTSPAVSNRSLTASGIPGADRSRAGRGRCPPVDSIISSVSICPACRQENPDIARFCLHCGTALETAAHREERRVVSVLFVDIVGFTSRSEAARPGGRARVPDAVLRARPRRRSSGHGGRIEKFVGDAVLGIFGAPVAHGDDAERAVRTALAIRDDARRDERRPTASSTSRRGIAVNTGEVIVDLDARPEAGETMVVGDVVNTAARLQSAAPPNGILVGRETYAATRTIVEYAPAPPVVAKGKAAPVEVVARAFGRRRRSGERALSEAPLVGRARELDLLARLWAQVCDERRPHLVTVIGPAGIGKSRLAEEFAAHVDSAGRPAAARALARRTATAPPTARSRSTSSRSPRSSTTRAPMSCARSFAGSLSATTS